MRRWVHDFDLSLSALSGVDIPPGPFKLGGDCKVNLAAGAGASRRDAPEIVDLERQKLRGALERELPDKVLVTAASGSAHT